MGLIFMVVVAATTQPSRSVGDVTRLSRWPKDMPRGGGPRTGAHRATGAASPLWDSYAM